MSNFSWLKAAAVTFSALCVLQATPAMAQLAEARTNTSPIFNKDFTDARQFLSERAWYDAIDRAQRVLKNDKRTPDDIYVSHFILLQANQGLRNRAGMRTAAQGMIDSGFPSEQLKADLLLVIAKIDAGERVW